MNEHLPAQRYAYRPSYESKVRRICTGCFRGFVQERTACGACGSDLRELVRPMSSEDFHSLDAEAKQDLQTRKIGAPKSHPDVLMGEEAL
jgi:hypothetical protein